MSIKTLYTFDINKEVEETVKEKSKDKDGSEITIEKTIKKNQPVSFGIRKANRKLYEEAELFYAVKLSEGIKAGLLTQPLLAKRYKNDGGPMSEPEKERYAEVYYEILLRQEKLEKLKLNLENKTEDERAKKAAVLMTDIIELQQELQAFESAQNSLFDQTAENRAKNMTIMWWVLHLAYTKEADDWVSVFGGDDYEVKLESYDKLEEKSDAYSTEVVKKFAYFITFWYLNGVSTEEEFKQIEKVYETDDSPEIDEEALMEGLEEEAKEEEAKEEEAKEEAPKQEVKAESPKTKRQSKKSKSASDETKSKS